MGAKSGAWAKALALSAAGAAGLAQPALAQSELSDEIIVTATRETTRLQDVAMSINVVSGAQLEELSLLDVKDIGQLAPGLSLTNNTGRSNTTTLRGISFDPDQATSPSVEVYLNEVPANAQTVYTALYDVGQIEVLRGPQGLLRGLSSPGGAITITTRRPDFESFEGVAQATATDRQARNVQFGAGGPISDLFALRIAGLWDENRGALVRNVTNGERSEANTASGRLTLGYRPNDALTAYLTYQYLDSDSRQYDQVIGPGGAPGGVASGPGEVGVDDRIATADGPQRFRNRSQFINLNVDWDLGPATLHAIAGYQHSELFQQRDLDAANAVPGYVQAQNIYTPFRVPTFEIRLASNDDGRFGWGLGAFYQTITGTTIVDQRQDVFFFPASFDSGLYLPIAARIDAPIDQQTVSFNANGRANLGQFTLEGGVRYTIAEGVRVTNVTVASPGYPGLAPFIPTIPAFTQIIEGIPDELRDQRAEPITGGITLTYHASEDLNAYVAYGRSYRLGAVGVSVPLGVSNDLLATDDEETDAIEVGLKGALFDNRLSFELAAFHQSFEGFLSRFIGIRYNCPNLPGLGGQCGLPPSAAPINNATDSPRTDGVFDFNYNGDATVQGVELTLNARPTDFWDLSVSMANIEARYDSGALLPCNDFNGDGRPDTDGTPQVSGDGNVSFCNLSRLSDTPDFSLSANSELRLPARGALSPFIRGLVSYRPDVFSEQRNYTYDSQTLVNLYAGVRDDGRGWEITLFVKNLLDQNRITNISAGNGTIAAQIGAFDPGYRNVNTMAPREFGITTRLSF